MASVVLSGDSNMGALLSFFSSAHHQINSSKLCKLAAMRQTTARSQPQDRAGQRLVEGSRCNADERDERHWRGGQEWHVASCWSPVAASLPHARVGVGVAPPLVRLHGGPPPAAQVHTCMSVWSLDWTRSLLPLMRTACMRCSLPPGGR